MSDYRPSNRPICEKISCPYWSGDTQQYGCQAYPSAGLCHLHGYSNKLCQANQYALYPGSITEGEGLNRVDIGQHALSKFELAALKRINDQFWLSSDRYTKDHEFAKLFPELVAARRWHVGVVDADAELID